MAEFNDQFDVVRRRDNYEAAANGFQLAVESDEQANTRGAEIGNSGKVKAEVMSATADQLFQVALEMFAPIVVEPPFNFYLKSIGELLRDDFHDGLRLNVPG